MEEPVKETMTVTLRERQFAVVRSEFDWFWEMMNRDKWEPETLTLIDQYVSEATTFLDIGAWIGPLSLYAAGSAGKVIAFEPDPKAFNGLRENLAANPSLKNVEPLHLFVGTSSGEITMGSRADGGDSQSSVLFGGGDNNAWQVKSIRLEDFLDNHRIDGPVFMKMDIEGAEYDLVPTLERVFDRHRPILFLSLHPFNLYLTIPGKTMPAKIKRRLYVVQKHYTLLKTLRRFFRLYDIHGKEITMSRALWSVLRGKSIADDNSLVAR